MREIPLPGGHVNRVVRAGDTVRREPGQRAEFVHRVLLHFEQRGWSGAPRFLGSDGQGREILSYVGLGPEVTDVGVAAERIRVLCDAYGWAEPLGRVIDTVLWWQERCWRGIEAGAADGDASLVALRGDGVADAVRAAWWWVSEHRDVLV